MAPNIVTVRYDRSVGDTPTWLCAHCIFKVGIFTPYFSKSAIRLLSTEDDFPNMTLYEIPWQQE